MKNALSIDIETWAYGDTPEFRNLTSEQRKRMDDGYLPGSTRTVLRWLREARAKITMFMVGEQFGWYPELVEEILADGHELGLHAFRHYRIDTLDQLRADLEKAMPLLQKYNLKGYRAPLIHLPEGGFDVLREFGFTFDSSTYGPYSMSGTYSGIREIPITSVMPSKRRPAMTLPRHLSFGNIFTQGEIPIGASYFVGVLRSALNPAIRRLNSRNIPAVFFLHNWQLVPRPKGAFPPPSYVLKHPLYWPLTRNLAPAFQSWLREFEFTTMSNLEPPQPSSLPY